MFDKILIANRGEIACRVIRTARRMGIRTVAVYLGCRSATPSTYREADEAVRISGPAPAAESYLVIDRDRSRPAPRHGRPGGASRLRLPVGARGLSVGARGRRGDVHRPQCPCHRGDGRQDRIQEGGRSGRRFHRAGASSASSRAPTRRCSIAEEIGFPVMIKASAGGGGKGMRIAHSAERGGGRLRAGANPRRPRPSGTTGSSSRSSSPTLVTSRSRCWATSTGMSSISASANAPSSAATRRSWRRPRRRSSTRRRGAGWASRLSRWPKAVGYDSAGTVEFVAGQDRSFFFLEMNTRLQVEHPVTEMVTGLDLVELMIRVAAGEAIADHVRMTCSSTVGRSRAASMPRTRHAASCPPSAASRPTGRRQRGRIVADGATIRNDTGSRPRAARSRSTTIR